MNKLILTISTMLLINFCSFSQEADGGKNNPHILEDVGQLDENGQKTGKWGHYWSNGNSITKMENYNQ